MAKTLTGKTAVVTGGSRGIGRAICLKLAEKGAEVFFSYLRDEQSAAELTQEIERGGGKAVGFKADVGKVVEVDVMFEEVMHRCGGFDILVNNAGIAHYKKIADFTEEEYDRIFDINLKGLFFCCKQAALKMRDNGSIINIGSTVTRVMLPTYGAYAATKGAVEQITKVLAKELGERGIRVNTLSPGPVDTELFRAGKSEEQINMMASMAALGRLGTVDDIAGMVALLVEEDAGWVSGQNILINGGFAA